MNSISSKLLIASIAVGISAACLAQDTTKPTTLPPPVTSQTPVGPGDQTSPAETPAMAPVSKKDMKAQRKTQKQQEKSASESAKSASETAKAQKAQAKALKHQDKATNAQEKAGTPAPAPVTPPQ